MAIKINNKIYDDLSSLASDMQIDVKAFSKALRNGSLLKFVDSLDNKKASKIAEILTEAIPDDVLIFKCKYILNPYLPFQVKNKLFKDYQDIGLKLLYTSPKTDIDLEEMIRYKLISFHMEITHYDEENKTIYQTLQSIENLAATDIQFAYFSAGYYLSKKQSIFYNNVEYKNLYNLCYYLCNKNNDLQFLGDYFSHSPMLKAFAKYCLKEKTIDDFVYLCMQNTKLSTDLDEYLEIRKKKL